jgi:hypothetical protein
VCFVDMKWPVDWSRNLWTSMENSLTDAAWLMEAHVYMHRIDLQVSVTKDTLGEPLVLFQRRTSVTLYPDASLVLSNPKIE